MKFGIFFEISIPRPWEPGVEKRVYDRCLEQTVLADELGFDTVWAVEKRVYDRCLEQTVLADELGFDTVWAVEHHFLEEYSHSSAPEIFLAACAMRTRRIRVGHGIVVCVPEINHPVRIAERAAVLDIVSDGRLEFGTGRSATWTELGGFGADPDETKAQWDEVVHALPRMWTEERFAHRGVYFSMPERAVLPKPLQKPHPPLWVAVTTPGTELDAADRGMGALGLSFASFGEQEKKAAAYRQRIRSCRPAGLFVNEQVAAVNFLYCHADDQVGVETGTRLVRTFGYLAAQLASAREAYPSRSYASFGLLPQLRRPSTAPGQHGRVPEGMCVGDPERIARTLRQWESAGVDQVNFLLNMHETVPHEEVLASLRLFAAEVMPRFRVKEAA